MVPPKVCQAVIDSSQCSRNLQYVWPEGCKGAVFLSEFVGDHKIETKQRKTQLEHNVFNEFN